MSLGFILFAMEVSKGEKQCIDSGYGPAPVSTALLSGGAKETLHLVLTKVKKNYRGASTLLCHGYMMKTTGVVLLLFFTYIQELIYY